MKESLVGMRLSISDPSLQGCQHSPTADSKYVGKYNLAHQINELRGGSHLS